MKKLILGIAILVICLGATNVYAEGSVVTVEFYEPGYEYEVSQLDLSLSLNTVMMIDNEGNSLLRLEQHNEIWKIDTFVNVTLLASIMSYPDGGGPNVPAPIEQMAFDRINGVLYCTVVDTIANEARMVKIMGFAPLSETDPLLDLQAQINNLDSALQTQITDQQTQIQDLQTATINQQTQIETLQQENQEQQEQIDTILSSPFFRWKIYPHRTIWGEVDK